MWDGGFGIPSIWRYDGGWWNLFVAFAALFSITVLLAWGFRTVEYLVFDAAAGVLIYFTGMVKVRTRYRIRQKTQRPKTT